MHLKHLEIVGFKSFSDRVKLDFGPGITAIVGPNGCGKSNVIDAFRWCLGEMSAKSLRSSMMMDVVFNGSGSRPPQNMAEVTLTFDNTDKRLPIDFTEVAISRRLFRSGESEYFINRTQCRLRDIKELFLDTGMGEDGYSSIEQGRVEWILNAKPEERRELFEEAAGVSKYRARREEAVRKLDRVEIDLSRLTDIISVTKDQIRKLETAVNRAKTYQRIKEELKQMEISDWLFQLSNFETQLQELGVRLTDIQNRAEQLNTQSHQADARLSELRTALTATEEQMLQANSILSEIDADIKVGQERLNSATQRENDLKNQVASFQEAIQREQTRITELTLQAEQQSQALQQVKDKGATIESDYEAAQAAFDGGHAKLEEKRTAVKQLRDAILDRAQERSRIQQQIAYLTSDVTRLDGQRTNLQKEKERVQGQINELMQLKLQAVAQVGDLKHQLSEKSAFLESKTQALADLNRREEEVRNHILERSEEIARLNGQIHSIEAQQSQDPYLSGNQAVLSSGIANIYGPVNRLIGSAQQSDRDLVAATIGEHLGDLVADTAEDAQRAIEYLAANEKGRARIWILDRLPQASDSGVADLGDGFRLSDRIQCEDKFRPLISRLCSHYVIKGSTAFGTAVINGGIDPSKWKSHVTHRLPELEATLHEKEKQKTWLEEEINQVTSQQTTISHERDAALKELEEFRIRVELMEEEHSKLSKKHDLLTEEEKINDAEIESLAQEKEKAQVSLDESRQRFEALQTQEQTDHAELDKLHQELSEMQITHANLNADLSTKKEKHLAFQDQLQWHTSVLEHTQKELGVVQTSIDRHQRAVDAAGGDLNNALNAQQEAKALIAASMDKRQGAADKCAEIQRSRAELSEQIQTLDAELHAVRKELSIVQETLQNERIQQISMQDRSVSLVQKLTDQYEMTIEAAKEQFQPQAADAESLEKLKKRVANIGPINMAAPQEHAELLEKDTFLSSQQADLLKAKDDLRQVIQKINATTREHFRETFEKVRENFRALYSQLFQGGEADLRLTESEDILSAGIDIYCQPPGKKLLHISLLSGGEKALTACALLFAFFQVRPSPVALLDEVDAPLDEANVLRYVDMIKRFGEQSQFLVITHNKRTMEASHNLYGVTMEELGVSKILSARLAKEKKKIEASIETEPATASH